MRSLLTRGRGRTLAALVGIGFLVAAACTGATPTATPRPTATTPLEPTATVQTQAEREERLQTALLQSYFLSVDNFAGPVMMGGIGIPFMPPTDSTQMLMDKAGLTMDMMPTNPGMVLAIYSSAEPRLAPGLTPEMGQPADFATMRWDPAGIDTAIQTRDQAMLIMKFVERAKYFHKAWEGETVLFPPPLERFLSNVFMVEPLMISQFASQNLMAEDGFVRAIKMEDGQRVMVDGSIDPFDQASMLWALSDLVLTMKSTDTYPNLQVQLPGMDDPMPMLSGMLDKLFMLVQMNPVTDTKEKGRIIVSLVWYAAASGDDGQRAAAINLIDQYAQALGQGEETAFERAASIRGLLEAWRVTKNDAYRDTALGLWNELDSLWDDEAKV